MVIRVKVKLDLDAALELQQERKGKTLIIIEITRVSIETKFKELNLTNTFLACLHEPIIHQKNG